MSKDQEYFRGKTATVTGAASGIGLALVEELLRRDVAKVVLADVNPERLNEHEARLKTEYGDRVKGILCDVTAEENVQKMIAKSATFFGGQFDLLFNNAGAPFPGWFDEAKNVDWKIAFDLNFFSAVYGMRAVLPIMVKQGSGQIVNIISGIAFSPMPMQSRYSATKAALHACSLSLRAEYGDSNIKISSATPGTVATPIWQGSKIPDTAQTPQQSACRILLGAANDDRIIFGDDADIKGAISGHLPVFNKEVDQFFLNIARERRKGNVGF